MKVELYQKIERATTHETIEDLFAGDFKISVLDGEQTTFKHNTDAATIKTAMFTTDEDQLYVEHQRVAEEDRVLFICGSDGHDVIADHTTNLELSLKGAFELANKIADENPAALAHVLAEVGA